MMAVYFYLWETYHTRSVETFWEKNEWKGIHPPNPLTAAQAFVHRHRRDPFPYLIYFLAVFDLNFSFGL